MEKEKVLSNIEHTGVIAVIRAQSAEQALNMAENCLKGGIDIIELAFTTPSPLAAIETLKKELGGKITLGAGTVLDAPSASAAMHCGADFIVSPHFDSEIIKACNRNNILSVAGFFTPTEGINAMAAGCDVLKLFPAQVLGPDFLKAILAPLPGAKVIPTGGIDADNIGAWLRAGAIAAGVGGKLLKGDIQQNAHRLTAQIKAAREEESEK